MPSEQERYSLDEMMDRLKSRQSGQEEQGEMVTREDGTQAIRVRKRRRRSHQPAKQKSGETTLRARLIQLSAAIALLLVALFVAGSALVYSNSPPYRNKLTANVSAATGAKVRLEQFRMNPVGANAAVLELAWPEGNILRHLRLSSLAASTHPVSFTGRVFTGDEVTAREGRLTLGIPSPGEEISDPESKEGNPEGINFKRYSIRKLAVQLGENPSPLMPRATDVEASFYAKHASGRPQLSISRGDVQIPSFPPLKLIRGHLEFAGKDINVVQMALRNDANRDGSLMLSGRISPYPGTDTPPLSVELKQFRVEHLLDPKLGQIFSGVIDTFESAKSNFLTFSQDGEGGLSPDFAANFTNSVDAPFTIKGFPFLAALRQLTDDVWFETPSFETTAKAELRKAAGETTIREMNFAAKGRMQIHGFITASPGGALNGELVVGVADPVIGASANARLLENVFGPEKNDLRWVPVRISGNTSAPADNFKKLVDDARARLAAENTTPRPASRAPAAGSSPPSFEDLTTPGK